MKRNRFILATGLTIATVLLVSASVWVFENRPTIWGHTEGMTQEEIMEKLHQLTIAEFLKDFDQAMDDIQKGKGDPELGICWAQVCIERASEFSDDEIINRIEEATFPAHRCWIFSLHSVYAAAGKNQWADCTK